MPTGVEKASATLGGKEIILDDSFEWTLRAGVEPNIETFTMAPADAKAIFGTGKPVELLINPVQGNPVKVQNLWVLKIMPGTNPYLSRVVVADRRWMWPHKHIERDYNIIRAIGTRRLVANDLVLQNFPDLGRLLKYWKWSTFNESGTPIDVFTMMRDLLGELSDFEKLFTNGTGFNSILDKDLLNKRNNIPIQELRISDPGHEAVQRALNQLPEAGITVDYDGTVIVFSRVTGGEINIVSALMPEIFGQGHVDLVDNSLRRPKEIHVLFTREVEVRFDFLEEAKASGGTTAELGTVRKMENVLPVPDYQLPMTFTSGTEVGSLNPFPGGSTQTQGTWITFDQAFNAWGNLPIQGVTRKLDHDLIQRAFIPQMDLWAALGAIGILPTGNSNLTNWVDRIHTCKTHYRQTFRLNRDWTDRFMSVRAYRVATIDLWSGQRAPSMAWGDYSILPSQRMRYRTIAASGTAYYAINRTGYPSTGNLDSTAQPSPGMVSVEDSDQGIIRINYLMDQTRSYEQVLPSQIVLGSMPTADITQRSAPIAFNDVVNASNPPRLSSRYKCAIIVTAVPASPNNNQKLHRVKVLPGDVKDALPAGAQASLGKCNGPIMEIRIGAGTETARIRWKDSESTTIEKIFGIGAKVPSDPASQDAFSKQVDALCTNIGSSDATTGASLNAIAKARAAAVWGSLIDRYEGSATFAMNGGVHLSGWTEEVSHQYTAKAGTFTKVTFPQTIPQMTLFAFLTNSERAILLRQVQP